MLDKHSPRSVLPVPFSQHVITLPRLALDSLLSSQALNSESFCLRLKKLDHSLVTPAQTYCFITIFSNLLSSYFN